MSGSNEARSERDGMEFAFRNPRGRAETEFIDEEGGVVEAKPVKLGKERCRREALVCNG